MAGVNWGRSRILVSMLSVTSKEVGRLGLLLGRGMSEVPPEFRLPTDGINH